MAKKTIRTERGNYVVEPQTGSRTSVVMVVAGKPELALVFGPHRLESVIVDPASTLREQEVPKLLQIALLDIGINPHGFGIPESVSRAQTTVEYGRPLGDVR